MPFIDTKDVAAMRKAIKAALPEFKVSVTKHHHSSVQVHLMEGPILPVEHVNVYWYKDNFRVDKLNRPDVIKVVDTILEKIFSVRKVRTEVVDGDYGAVPNFYYDVAFGKWDKEYVCTDPDAADKLAVKQLMEETRYHEHMEMQIAEMKAARAAVVK